MAQQEANKGEEKRTVVIIGGGLAGMTVAKELLKHYKGPLKVVILEASHRLGGKAGADNCQKDILIEHGYHIFPGWYPNVRQLLKEIPFENGKTVADNLIDIEKFHILKKAGWQYGVEPELHSFYPLSSPWLVLKNLRSLAALTSLPDAILGFYALLDLNTQSFDERSFLDRITANAFFRSRFYATEALAGFHMQTILQATSVPTYQISAMTLRKVMSFWMAEDVGKWSWLPRVLQTGWLAEPQHGQKAQMKYLQGEVNFPKFMVKPFSKAEEPNHKIYSILNGNLQKKFISPFEDYLRSKGLNKNGKKEIEIKLKYCVEKIEINDEGRISHVIGAGPQGEPFKTSGDIFIVATPPEATLRLLGRKIIEVEEKPDAPDKVKLLSNVARLLSAPMASLHLFLRDRLEGAPREHVNLLESRYGLSFIDISQNWEELKGREGTILSVIAANFRPLEKLPPEEAEERLVGELKEYIPIHDEDIADSKIMTNSDSPLFLNTVGAWQFRPISRTRIRNLYTAGDYCQTPVDLTTMESAVTSGLYAARSILDDEGDPHATRKVKIIQPKEPSKELLFFLKYNLLPSIFLLSTGQKLWDKFFTSQQEAAERRENLQRLDR